MIKIAYVPRLLREQRPEEEQNSIHGYFLRNQHLFEAEGITLDLFGEARNCDIAWIGNAVWEENKEKYSDLPLIQDLVTDDSWLSARARNILTDDRVIGLTRGAVLRNLNLYNGESFDGSYHGKLVYDATPEFFEGKPNKTAKQLDTKALQKMIATPGFPHLLRLEKVFKWAEKNPDLATGGGPRPHTCHFVGTVEFARVAISVHRKLACSVLAEREGSELISGKSRSPSDRMSRGKYLETLRESKVCVSPWGYGERCNRDYEAIVSGCVLVKPNSSHIVMCPDMFHAEANIYVPCKVDFSDLPKLIHDIEQNWSNYQPMRERAYDLLMESIRPEVAIKPVCTAIKEKYMHYMTSIKKAA